MLDLDAKLYPLLSSRKRMPAFRIARLQTFMADHSAPTDRSYLLLDMDNGRDGFLFQESMRDPGKGALKYALAGVVLFQLIVMATGAEWLSEPDVPVTIRVT
jgi:hypothetical protein